MLESKILSLISSQQPTFPAALELILSLSSKGSAWLIFTREKSAKKKIIEIIALAK